MRPGSEFSEVNVRDDVEAFLSSVRIPQAVQETILSLGKFWNDGAFGVSYGSIVSGAGILLLALILRGIFVSWILRLLRKAVAGTQNAIDDALVEALSGPLKFVFLIVGLDLALRIVAPSEDAQAIADRFVRSLIAITVFWALHRLANCLRLLFASLSQVLAPSTVDWLVKALQVVFMLVGAAAVLEIWGVKVAPLLAGLGIFGVAVALGAQDLFKNLIAGLAVLLERRFQQGDWIKVEGIVEGVVESIHFRSTVVRQFDDVPVYVPNAHFSDNAVVNFSRMTRRRIKWIIGLEYGSTVEQLRRVRDRIEKTLLDDENFVHPPNAPLFVRIDRFNDSSIDILIYCFTRTTSWGKWLALKEDFALKVKQIVEEEGAAFAFPSASIYMADAGATPDFEDEVQAKRA